MFFAARSFAIVPDCAPFAAPSPPPPPYKSLWGRNAQLFPHPPPPLVSHLCLIIFSMVISHLPTWHHRALAPATTQPPPTIASTNHGSTGHGPNHRPRIHIPWFPHRPHHGFGHWESRSPLPKLPTMSGQLRRDQHRCAIASTTRSNLVVTKASDDHITLTKWTLLHLGPRESSTIGPRSNDTRHSP